MIRWILATLVVTSMVLVMAGCNTVNGFGRDTEKAGDKIQEKAQEHGAD